MLHLHKKNLCLLSGTIRWETFGIIRKKICRKIEKKRIKSLKLTPELKQTLEEKKKKENKTEM